MSIDEESRCRTVRVAGRSCGRGADRAGRRSAPAGARPDAAGAGSRTAGRGERCANGTTCGCSRAGASWSTRPPPSCWRRPAGAGRTRTVPDGAGVGNGVPAAAGGGPGCHRAGRRSGRTPSHRGRPPRPRPCGRLPDVTASRSSCTSTHDGGGAQRMHGARGHRRLRHLERAEPAGRRRASCAGRGRARRRGSATASRPHRSRCPGPGTPASTVAVAGTGALGLERAGRPRRPGRATTPGTQIVVARLRRARSATRSAAARTTSWPPVARWASGRRRPSSPGTSRS